MRNILLLVAVLTPTCASAQSPPPKNLKPLFEAVQKVGTDSELRGDIADRLGFGEHPLAIKDLVISVNGVQHAVNAFKVSDKSYLLFDSHLYAPEVYIFVKNTDGTLAAGIHGEQYQPITSTIDMRPSDGLLVIDPEEAFWSQWLAAGAKAPAPVK